MSSRVLLATLLALCSTLATAQGTVYESKDRAGPVFSDAPSSGAKSLELPPLSVIQEPQAPPQPPPAQTVAPAPYSGLTIVAPANEGTIHTNTGAFDLHVQIQPALRISDGDAIIVKLDGNRLGDPYQGGRLGACSHRKEYRAQFAGGDYRSNRSRADRVCSCQVLRTPRRTALARCSTCPVARTRRHLLLLIFSNRQPYLLAVGTV